MYTNELLEEIWAIKAQLAAEADGDIHKFCDRLREFSEKMPRKAPVVRTPEETARFLDFIDELPAAVREDDANYGGKSAP